MRKMFLVTLAALVLRPGGAVAGLPETLARVKASVVAVGTFQRTRSPAFRFLATGFAVGAGRSIATNAHALPVSVDSEHFEQLVVALPSGDGKTEVRAARRGGIDGEHDVALLLIDGAPLPALRLSERDQLPEGSEIAFTGFPIGGALGLTPVTHRGIVSALTPISIPQGNARRLDPKMVRSLADPFRVYQLDATAYPGNSGSPLYDIDTGEVVGIINMVFVKSTKESAIADPSGITYAIPIRYLQALEGQ